MMRNLLLAALLFALALHAVSAQDPAAERAEHGFRGWKTVLEPGTLGRNPDIVPVEGGFAVSAESFADPTWIFDSEWVLYDPDTDTWSPLMQSPYSTVMVSIHDESVAHHQLANHLPEESTDVQLVNGGTHAVFIQHPGWNPSHYVWGIGIIDLSTYKITKLTYWGGSGQPQKLVRDFPEENLIIGGDVLVWLDGDEVQKQWLDDYIVSSEFSDLGAVSISPDKRFWLLGADTIVRPDYLTDAGLLYDRETGELTALFAGDWGIPSYQRSVWLDSRTLLINRRGHLLLVDAESGEQTKLMEAELLALHRVNPYNWHHLSTDWQWLVAELYNDGGLLIHKVYDKNRLGA